MTIIYWSPRQPAAARRERPLDIDRLLVVTFTRAAAAQMRERIARAVSDRLREDPSNAHLRRQETLIHNAQITTIDSFCSYLLRNNFSEIDLDPDFRVMDQTESELMSADVLDSFLEECYQQADPAFLECAAYFCPGSDDRGLQKMIADLYTMSSSRPQPEFWLKQRREDYHVESKEEIFTSLWLQTGILQTLEQLEDMDRQYSDMLEICGEPDGPEGYAALLTLEQDSLFRTACSANCAGNRSCPSGRDIPAAFCSWPAVWTRNRQRQSGT